jgi:hypothetical protein
METITIKKTQMRIFMRFTPIYILLLGFTLAFASCNKTENEDDSGKEELAPATIVKRGDVLPLIAIAAERSFEGNITKSGGSTASTASIRPKTKTPAIRYEFDYIKINEATRFSTNELKIPIIKETCGEGKIEVYFAVFTLFISNNSIVGGDNLTPIIGDLMIVFKGELGMYCCMDNGTSLFGNLISELSYNSGPVFSSHKFFKDGALEKNFDYPLYQFYTKNLESDKVTVASSAHTGDNEFTYTTWFPLYNKEKINPDQLFSIIELSAMTEISLQCKVTGIEENYFIVETDKQSNLQQVYFDEYTGFFEGDNTVSSAQIAVGNTITVTFDKLYDFYNPKLVLANKIIKN